jgi:hypothetical protein
VGDRQTTWHVGDFTVQELDSEATEHAHACGYEINVFSEA